MEDPDASENWPRVWIIWRANAILSSAKGHEYFLKHYLGAHDNAIADEVAKGSVAGRCLARADAHRERWIWWWT